MSILKHTVQTIDGHPWVATLSCLALCLYMYNKSKKLDLGHIPSVGYSNAILSYLDLIKYHLDAGAFIQRGYDKASLLLYKDQAFRIPNIRRWVVVLNGSKYLEELRKVPEDVLSSRANIAEALQIAHILGRNFTENHYHINVIRHQMTRKVPEFLPELFDEIKLSFEKSIPLENQWKSYNPNTAFLRVVCESINRICIGAPYCRDSELIGTSLILSAHLSLSAPIIGGFPEFLQPYLPLLIPGLAKAKRRWIEILDPLIEERKRRRQKGEIEPVDVLSWLIDEAPDSELNNENLAIRIFLINFGAMGTTTLISVHVLYHLASELRYLALLRQDIEEAIAAEGWTKAALDRMHKLDAFIKETMRMHPISVALVGHKSLRDYTFSDGTVIPKNTTLMAPANAIHYDESIYSDAHQFQGFRFLDEKSSGTMQAKQSFVSLTPEYMPFGYGNYACPGRFFAASAMKLMLAHFLVHYDFKLEKGATPTGGKRPDDFFWGGLRMPNRNAHLLICKREE